MSKTIVCIGGRCSSWGKNWSRHYYDGGEVCLRCGMSRKEQFEEDKACGLVTGGYIPNTGIPRADKPVTSKRTMYCVVGEYGIEFASDKRKESENFIAAEEAGEGHGDEPAPVDYYYITTMTKAELHALPED